MFQLEVGKMYKSMYTGRVVKVIRYITETRFEGEIISSPGGDVGARGTFGIWPFSPVPVGGSPVKKKDCM